MWPRIKTTPLHSLLIAHDSLEPENHNKYEKASDDEREEKSEDDIAIEGTAEGTVFADLQYLP